MGAPAARVSDANVRGGVSTTNGHPEVLARRVPMGRAGAPEEVARAIVWLASDEASFVSGVVFQSTVAWPRLELAS